MILKNSNLNSFLDEMHAPIIANGSSWDEAQ